MGMYDSGLPSSGVVPGKRLRVVEYLAGATGTHTFRGDTVAYRITAVAGGGGGSAGNVTYVGGGGGAGEAIDKVLPVISRSVSYSVGSGGGASTVGGNTTFGTVTLLGGQPGTLSSGAGFGGGFGGGAPNTSSTTMVRVTDGHYPGGAGGGYSGINGSGRTYGLPWRQADANDITAGGSASSGAGGGSSFLGTGGTGAVGAGAGSTGSGYGAGGGGGSNSGAGTAGGAGTGGYIRIEEFA